VLPIATSPFPAPRDASPSPPGEPNPRRWALVADAPCSLPCCDGGAGVMLFLRRSKVLMGSGCNNVPRPPRAALALPRPRGSTPTFETASVVKTLPGPPRGCLGPTAREVSGTDYTLSSRGLNESKSASRLETGVHLVIHDEMREGRSKTMTASSSSSSSSSRYVGQLRGNKKFLLRLRPPQRRWQHPQSSLCHPAVECAGGMPHRLARRARRFGPPRCYFGSDEVSER
jgi:hypothetical protein